jgi:type I site-specific restriction-modification system R (restriction) subunit
MDAEKNEKEHPIFGKVISAYTQDEAIEDGVLVHVGSIGRQRVVFTRTLFNQGYEDEAKRKALIEMGLELLCRELSEDSPDMRLRVIEKDKIWVIWNVGEGFTFLTPADY